MGRAPCCDKANVKRGPWSPEEDAALKSYLQTHGTGGNWIALPRKAGLRRCGKSCRLRWLNYLRPDIKHGGFTEEEDHTICNLYKQLGSRWSVIASRLPGRTDNDVKNYWNTKLKKKLLAGKISLATNSTTITNASQFPSTNYTTANNSTAIIQPDPPNYNNLLVPKAETDECFSSFPNSGASQNPATLADINSNKNHGLMSADDQRSSFQYDQNSLFSPRFVDFSDDRGQFNDVINPKNSHIINYVSLLSQDQVGSDKNVPDLSSVLTVNDTKPCNGCYEYGGTTLMDFGFGIPYDFIDNGMAFDQEIKAISHDHDHHDQVVAPDSWLPPDE